MLNKLKLKANDKLGLNLRIKCIVTNQDNWSSQRTFRGSIRNSEFIILERGYGAPEPIMIYSYVKIGDVFHLDTNRGAYVVRIL